MRRDKEHRNNRRRTDTKRGFIALVSVVLLAIGAMTSSVMVMSVAVAYADAVARREFRIYATLNAEACADAAALMTAKDVFMAGSIEIADFHCIAMVPPHAPASSFVVHAAARAFSNPHRDSRAASGQGLESVQGYASRTVTLPDF